MTERGYEKEMLALCKKMGLEAKFIEAAPPWVDAVVLKDGNAILIECKYHRAGLVEKTEVKSAPGENLSRLAQLCMSAEAHERFVWPAIQDLRVEYEDIKKAGGPIRAGCVLIRGYASVFPHLLYGLVARIIKWVFTA